MSHPVVAVLGKVATVVGGLAIAGLIATIVIPPAPPVQAQDWFDQPLPGAIFVTGEQTVKLHLKDDPGLVKIDIERNGIVAYSIIDSDLDYLPEGENRAAPYLAEGTYTFAPGVYTLTPNYQGSKGPSRSITVTAIEEGGELPVGVPQPTATPKPTPTPLPTQTASPTPVVPLPPTDQPPVDVPPDLPPPAYTPPPATVYETPYGVARMATPTRSPKYQNVQFIVRLATPQTAVGYIQYQVRDYQTPWDNSAWITAPCQTNLQADPSAPGRYTCSTASISIVLDAGQHTGYYRVLLTNGDKTFTGDPLYWTVPFQTPG